MSHRIRATALVLQERTMRRAGPKPPKWPSYRGNSEFVGTSPSGQVTVYVDPTLGQPASQNAKDLVKDADRVVKANDAIFGAKGGAVSVIIFALDGRTDGTGGADHMGCDYTTGNAIEVCASFGRSERVSALFEAELSECSMGGNLCGLNTGEALSRWCTAVLSTNVLADFATAPQWAQYRMPDFVNQNHQHKPDDERQWRLDRVRCDAQGHRRAGHGELRQSESFERVHRQAAKGIDDQNQDRLELDDENAESQEHGGQNARKHSALGRCR